MSQTTSVIPEAAKRLSGTHTPSGSYEYRGYGSRLSLLRFAQQDSAGMTASLVALTPA
jgi:hypothetical protein